MFHRLEMMFASQHNLDERVPFDLAHCRGKNGKKKSPHIYVESAHAQWSS